MFLVSRFFRLLPRVWPSRLTVLVGLALAAGAGRLVAVEAADLEFFEKKIRPLLAERCYECHSAEHKTKAGLRLDVTEGWMKGGDSGAAVVPGQVDQSALIKAVRYTGLEFEPMPPKSALSREEVALLEEWVKRGAPGPVGDAVAAKPRSGGMTLAEGRKFWAFVPPTAAPIPAGRGAGWARSPIDHFLAAKWEEKGLRPAADADRATLFRRLSFDLTGLPPEPEAQASFVADQRMDARERAIDGMLASPHFGERWGRHWLDVARFAESSGGGRTLMFKDAWRYRDYVIDAFNRDLPFDRFIREQIAGDLLPYATAAERRRQVIATAFLALGPTNYEEQNKGALRMDVVDEQIDTLGKAFLGLTLGCARCHDHKFDPVPTRDYYALAGILRSTHTLHNYTDNVAKWVDAALPLDAAAEKEIAAHDAKVAALERRIATLRATTKVATALTKSTSLKELPGLVVDDPQAKVVGRWKSSQTTPGYFGEGYLSDDNELKGEKTVTFTPVIGLAGRYEVRLAYPALANRATNVPVTVFHADGEQLIMVNQRETPPMGGRFLSLGVFRFEKDGQGYVLVSNEGTDGFVVVDALQLLPADERKETAAAPPAGADQQNRKQLVELRKLEAELKKLNAGGPQRLQAMSVREAVGEIGDTEVRIRGVARNLGPKVPRGFLQVAAYGPAPEFSPTESGRRELADWIGHPANPLTARVLVNRVWAWLMGAGLVRSVDNLGTTGDRPTHPELLDHLARQFVADGWSVKQLVREIVRSRAYGLATAGSAEASRLDPDNVLLSHAPRRRLDAEQIRDAILWAGGKLDRTVGGPNISGGAAANASEYGYVFTDTRRSVYTPAFRNRRLELFEVFDFADVNASIGQRSVSTVAPQALFLMNHPFVLDQARFAAERVLAVPLPDEATRIERAYRVALGRAPTPAELALAKDFLRTAGGADARAEVRLEAWTELQQSIFSCVDFRYLN